MYTFKIYPVTALLWIGEVYKNGVYIRPTCGETKSQVQKWCNWYKNNN